MVAPHDSRPKRRYWIGLVLALLIGGAALWELRACAIPSEPHLLHYDEASYLEVAEQMVRAEEIPRVGMRPPLYPAILAAFTLADPDAPLPRVVQFQKVVWAASAVLVGVLAALVTGRFGLGLLAALLFLSMVEPLSLVRLIYPEAVASFLALLSLMFFVCGRRAPSAQGWIAAAAVAAVGAAYCRPIFQILLPVYIGLAFIEPAASVRTGVRRALPFLVAGAVFLGPFYLYNGWTHGSFYFVKVAHLSVINYIGDRRLIGRYPADLEHVEDVYEEFFRTNPDTDRVPFWKVLPELQRAHEARGGHPVLPENFGIQAGRDAVAVLAANPDYYLTRWRETWSEFSRGAYAPTQGTEICPLAAASGFWPRFWSATGTWLPFAILVVQLALYARRWPRASPAELGPILIYLVVALANTAVEPWGGQIRYRAPLQGFLVIALLVVASTLWDWFRAVALRNRSPVPESGKPNASPDPG